ncbi:MAG TPA: hypothetical protein VJU14_02930 [Solirubrobacterales bacterium]|nr:hypothetical protein [Solirubrobacterales bacterium]
MLRRQPSEARGKRVSDDPLLACELLREGACAQVTIQLCQTDLLAYEPKEPPAMVAAVSARLVLEFDAILTDLGAVESDYLWAAYRRPA